MKFPILTLVTALLLFGERTAAQAPPEKGKETAEVADNKELAPTVEIVSVDTLSGDEAKVCVVAEARGDTISKIELSVRGRKVRSARRGLGSGEGCPANAVKFTVSLLPGPNAIEAVAYAANTPSQPARAEVRGFSPLRNSTLRVFTVGVDAYPNGRDKLNYARRDARSFADSLAVHAEPLFAKVLIDSLFDGAATKSAIEQTFMEIAASADSTDTFVFFFAGHGTVATLNPQTAPAFYLASAQVADIENDLMVVRGGVSAALLQEWLSLIPSKSKLVVLDACQSGSVVEHFGQKGLAPVVLGAAGSASQTAILAAASPSQPASEVGDLEHGLFTEALLRSLSGTGGPPEVRGVLEIATETEKQVHTLYREYSVAPQKPWMLSQQNFPLIFR